jgi:hypothetical protein
MQMNVLPPVHYLATAGQEAETYMNYFYHNVGTSTYAVFSSKR